MNHILPLTLSTLMAAAPAFAQEVKADEVLNKLTSILDRLERKAADADKRIDALQENMKLVLDDVRQLRSSQAELRGRQDQMEQNLSEIAKNMVRISKAIGQLAENTASDERPSRSSQHTPPVPGSGPAPHACSAAGPVLGESLAS